MKTKTAVRITLVIGLIALGSLLGGSFILEDITDSFLNESIKDKVPYEVVKDKAIEQSQTYGKIVLGLETSIDNNLGGV